MSYDERVIRKNFPSIAKVFLIALITLLISLSLPTRIYADEVIEDAYVPTPIYHDATNLKITLTGPENYFIAGKCYAINLSGPNTNKLIAEGAYKAPDFFKKTKAEKTNELVFQFGLSNIFQTVGNWSYSLLLLDGCNSGNGSFLPNYPSRYIFSYHIYPSVGTGNGLPSIEIGSPIQTGQQETLTVINVDPEQDYTMFWKGEKKSFQHGPFKQEEWERITVERQGKTFTAVKRQFIIDKKVQQQPYFLCIRQGLTFGPFGFNCDFQSQPIIISAVPVTPTITAGNEAGIPTGFPTSTVAPIPSPPCAEGYFKNGKCTGVDTAIGIISTEPGGFVKSIFSLVLGLAGGIALILIIIGGYRVMASAGNPEAMQAAREQLISAVVGLLFIIFSLVILEIIGVDILRIPGFSK